MNLKDQDLIRAETRSQKEIDDLNKERELLLRGHGAASTTSRLGRSIRTTSAMQLTAASSNALKATRRPELTRGEPRPRHRALDEDPGQQHHARTSLSASPELGDRLREHIVGQDEAIDAVCAAIKRNRVGLQAKRKPVELHLRRRHRRRQDGAGQAPR